MKNIFLLVHTVVKHHSGGWDKEQFGDKTRNYNIPPSSMQQCILWAIGSRVGLVLSAVIDDANEGKK